MRYVPPQGTAANMPPGWSPPPNWAPPQGWGPPQNWAPPAGWAPPRRWAPPAGWGPGWTPAGRSMDRSRLLPTLLVALVIVAVVGGGIAVDASITAPSAGTLIVNGTVSVTAAPGWVEVTSDDPSFTGVELRKANAILTAQVDATDYTRDSATLLASERPSLDAEVAQISYGDPATTMIGGHDTTSVVFEATVASGSQSGVVDGELICMVVDGNAVVILVAASQGHFDAVSDDVTAMLRTVKATQ